MIDDHAFAAVQARAFNAHDIDLMMQQSLPFARILRDGELIGEGPDALRDGIEAEYRSNDLAHARVIELDGEPVLAEFAGDEDNEVVKGIMRFKAFGGRLGELHIDHGDEAMHRLQR